MYILFKILIALGITYFIFQVLWIIFIIIGHEVLYGERDRKLEYKFWEEKQKNKF